MNRAELRTLVLTYSDDPNAGYFTYDIVNVFLNDALREVQKKLLGYGANYYDECVETQTIINQRNYSLPLDFLQLNTLCTVVAGTTPNESIQVVDQITNNQEYLVPTGSGQPLFYSIKKSNIFLYPCPNLIQTLRMQYSYLAAEMTLDTDIPDVPEAYHKLIALYAAQDCYLKDQRVPDLIIASIAKFEKQMDSAANERTKDAPRMIVETGNSYDYRDDYY